MEDENSSQAESEPAPDHEHDSEHPLCAIAPLTDEPSVSDRFATPETNWQSVLRKFLIFEFAMVPIAILLIYLFGLPQAGNIAGQLFGEDSWISGLVFGMLATVPLLSLFVLSELFGSYWKPFRELRNLVFTKLMPMMRGIPSWGLLLISLGAGFGEEWFFRGFLQQLVKFWLGADAGIWPAVLIVSLLFGACHALSKTYFLLTFIIGIYFGYLVELTGSVLPAALSHAGYDFVALIYLMTLDNQLRQQERKEVLEDGEGPADSTSVEDLEKESTNQ